MTNETYISGAEAKGFDDFLMTMCEAACSPLQKGGDYLTEKLNKDSGGCLQGISDRIEDKCERALEPVKDFGQGIDKKISSSNFVLRRCRKRIRKMFKNQSDQALMAYNLAVKGHLEEAYFHFKDDGNYFGIAFVAIKMTDELEKRLEQGILDRKTRHLRYYLMKMHRDDFRFDDISALRLATIFRTYGYEGDALYMEEKYKDCHGDEGWSYDLKRSRNPFSLKTPRINQEINLGPAELKGKPWYACPGGVKLSPEMRQELLEETLDLLCKKPEWKPMKKFWKPNYQLAETLGEPKNARL